MGNPNSGKGRASKLEAFMNYQNHKQKKQISENLVEQNECKEQNDICKFPEITENKQLAAQEFDQPTMKDFTDVIEDSNILHDKDLSLQLLFLMNYFIKMKMSTDCE